MRRKTTLPIDGADFFINGRPTYEGRTYNSMRIEGLLLNSRMVGSHASWGFFDYRRKAEGFGAGYQSMLTNWGIRTQTSIL